MVFWSHAQSPLRVFFLARSLKISICQRCGASEEKMAIFLVHRANGGAPSWEKNTRFQLSKPDFFTTKVQQTKAEGFNKLWFRDPPGN